ncbi:NrpR regulatory domain-containing protein [Natrinema sp. SYSU A 869]|uniref:NrpR regulatory domain-containing protein n=1 Tax=Natrinema sp. SYSU A 869 TaxID=2871694 RepID=UPI001CA4576D|nr:NrpR regulatory domain-containing protein [Natrinema sp. SYSU A 869]
MPENLDRRAYDLLRLIDGHEPIGSIRLVDLLNRHGYSIKSRTVRLMLSNLDDAGYTKKIPGKGRCLTPEGQSELERGHVGARLEQVRERIRTLTGQVTYDPFEDTGEVVAASITVPRAELDAALDAIEPLAETPLGPIRLAIEEDVFASADSESADLVRLSAPSSITLDGVLLSRGINAELRTAGIVEYYAGHDADAFPHEGAFDPDNGGAVLRYTDAISGEGSTVDVVSLLTEAGRTAVRPAFDDSDVPALFVVDNREFPLTRYDEAVDLAIEARDRLGGVLDVRKPREDGPFPTEKPGWGFASMTYGAVGELVLSLLTADGYAESWETLSGLVPRSRFERVSVVRARRT